MNFEIITNASLKRDEKMSEDKQARYRLSSDEIHNSKHFQGFERSLDQSYQLHWHDYMELELITGGSGIQYLNNVTVPLMSGVLTVLRLTDYHEVIPQPRLKMYNLSFEERFLSDKTLNLLTSIKEPLYFVLSQEDFFVISQLCDFCRQESESSHFDLQYITNLLECIFIKLFRQKEFKTSKYHDIEDTPIHRVMLYMHAHFRENPSLDQLAEIAHYTPCYFSTVFHKTIGVTYSDYLNQLKIKYAKQLLLTTNLKSIDIGFQCGFNSFNSFLRAFKASTGLTPMEYKHMKETVKPQK